MFDSSQTWHSESQRRQRHSFTSIHKNLFVDLLAAVGLAGSLSTKNHAKLPTATPSAKQPPGRCAGRPWGPDSGRRSGAWPSGPTPREPQEINQGEQGRSGEHRGLFICVVPGLVSFLEVICPIRVRQNAVRGSEMNWNLQKAFQCLTSKRTSRLLRFCSLIKLRAQLLDLGHILSTKDHDL